MKIDNDLFAHRQMPILLQEAKIILNRQRILKDSIDYTMLIKRNCPMIIIMFLLEKVEGYDEYKMY